MLAGGAFTRPDGVSFRLRRPIARVSASDRERLWSGVVEVESLRTGKKEQSPSLTLSNGRTDPACARSAGVSP